MTTDIIPTAYKISRLRLPFTYIMAMLAIVYAPSKLFLPALALIVLGMLIRIWAAGHVVKRDKLSEGGPYAYMRNPLYFGSFLGALGAFLLIQNWWLLLVFVVGFAFFYGNTIRSEENYLIERYKDQFEEYKRTVPVFIPRIKPATSVKDSEFAWQGVVRNGEHKALCWSLIAVLGIVVRAYFC